MNAARAALFTRILLVPPLAIAAGVLGVEAARAGGAATGAFLFAGAAVLTWFGVPAMQRRGLPIGWTLLPAALLWVGVLPELALRAAGFHYESGYDFGAPFEMLDRDPELFWKFPPERADVNSLGLPGPEVEIPKPRGVYRALFLGDSVTFQGYPAVVERELADEVAARGMRFDAVVLAVVGYSSYHGRVLVDRYADTFEPDLAIVFYGWNDHWRAPALPDAERPIVPITARTRIFDALFHNVRLLQALRWGMVQAAGGEAPGDDRPRVSLQQYEANLEHIRDRLASPVVYLTAPSAHPAFGVPMHLVDLRFAESKDQILERHAAYNEVVRRVASQTQSPLLDLEREVEALPRKQMRELFRGDGIHLTSEGNEFVGRRVAGFLRQREAWNVAEGTAN